MHLRWTGLVLVAGLGFAAIPSAIAQAPRLLSWGNTTGVRSARSGHWTELALAIVNPTSADVEPLAAVFFTSDRNLQYGRRLWVPAGGRRQTSHLALVPETPEARQLQLGSLFLLERGKEVNQQSEPGQRIDSTAIALERENSVTAFLATDRNEDPAYNLVISGRIAASRDRRIGTMFDSQLPSMPEAWDAADQVVLADDRIAADAAALAALRVWLMRGGHLVLILDRLSPATVETLLQDDWTGQFVDRVGLSTVALVRSRDGLPYESFELEKPVELARIVTEDVNTILTVNDWPAVCQKPIGRGQVTFFALGPEAFIRRRMATDRPRDDRNALPWVAGAAWAELAPRIFEPRPSDLTPHESLTQAATERIGYRIPDRGLVAGVLCGACGLLLVGGLLAVRRNRLEHLAWLVPLISLGAGTLLAGMAHARRTATPPMMVTAHLAPVAENQQTTSIHGVLAVYSPDGGPARLGSRTGGVFLPASKSIADSTRRMVWTDLDCWEWENLSLPAGVTPMPFQSVAELKGVSVEAAFGSRGLEGTLRGAKLDDVVLLTESRRAMTATLDAAGQFTIDRGQVQSPGTFISQTLLTDEQRRRQQVYEQYHREFRKSLPKRPWLLGWRDASELELVLPVGAVQASSALVSIPVRLRPTAPGVPVVIPSALLPFRPVADPASAGQSSSYDYRSGEWTERAGPSTAWQRVQFPETVLPLDLKRVNVAIQIVGPAGRLALLMAAGKSIREIAIQQEPVGTVRFVLERPEDLQLDAAGGLTFGLQIGRPGEVVMGEARGLLVWRIESLQVDAEGVVAKK